MLFYILLNKGEIGVDQTGDTPEYIQVFSSDPNERAAVIHGNLASSATETFTPGIVYRNFDVFKNALWWQRLSQNERRNVVVIIWNGINHFHGARHLPPPKARRPTAPDKSTSVVPTLPIPSPQTNDTLAFRSRVTNSYQQAKSDPDTQRKGPPTRRCHTASEFSKAGTLALCYQRESSITREARQRSTADTF